MSLAVSINGVTVYCAGLVMVIRFGPSPNPMGPVNVSTGRTSAPAAPPMHSARNFFDADTREHEAPLELYVGAMLRKQAAKPR